jgi:hypothetical protein
VCNTVTAFHISSSNYGLDILTVPNTIPLYHNPRNGLQHFMGKETKALVVDESDSNRPVNLGWLSCCDFLIKIFKAPHASYAIGMLSIDYSIGYRRTMMPATENWA